jgi:hypothetical protein
MAHEDLPYYQAARFKTKTLAGIVYNTIQDLIYHDIDCDLSAYRIKLNGTWHVIVIGEKPSDKLHVAIEAQLTNGTLVTVDRAVLLRLMDRRAEATLLGPWVEAHYLSPEE